MSSLEGRVAVITGGASGIGKACARLMHERGARIAIADMNLEQAQAVAKDLGGIAVEMDVRVPDSITVGAEKIHKDLGTADILVTSAGVTQLPVPAEELPVEVWDRMQEVDLRGTWLSAIAFGEPMLKRGKGAIVTIASITASRSVAVHSYAAAKRAVTSITESLAAEHHADDININCILPGTIDTAINRADMPNADHSTWVPCEDLANTMLFLTSPLARSINGAVIPVYGKS